MSIDREIQRLRLRIKQLGKQINPPTLRCIVVDQNQGEQLPLSEEVGIYDLVINIEEKPEWAFKKGY